MYYVFIKIYIGFSGGRLDKTEPRLGSTCFWSDHLQACIDYNYLYVYIGYN